MSNTKDSRIKLIIYFPGELVISVPVILRTQIIGSANSVRLVQLLLIVVIVLLSRR